MAKYNPQVPQILGQEYVPIRDENTQFSPAVNTTELGHAFTLPASRTLRDARFYTNRIPQNFSSAHIAQFAIYPAGLEDKTGPIRSVIIPVSTGNVTGSEISTTSGSVRDALYSSSTEGVTVVDNGVSSAPQELDVFFGTNAYAQELQGKRILNVSLVYSGAMVDFNAPDNTYVNPNPNTPVTLLNVLSDNSADRANIPYHDVSGGQSNTGTLRLNTFIAPGQSTPDKSLQRINLGDVFYAWNPTNKVIFGTQNDVMPWRFADLQRFESTAVDRLRVHVIFQVLASPFAGPVSNVQATLSYMAMRVIYCDETRVAVGGRRVSRVPYLNTGVNIVTMRTMNNVADPVLPAGKYVKTLSFVDAGDIEFWAGLSSDFPDLNALRELYEIPDIHGVRVNVPFPYDEHIGDTFTSEPTSVLTQLSLHDTTGAVFPEGHVYGRQAVAQVWGSHTAIQEINDNAIAYPYANAAFPQVRFYARRYGDTTVPLRLDSVNITGAGLSVSITPKEWDALPNIIDNWKEVTLRFPTAPVMGTVPLLPLWRWSALHERAGSRWEVLGAAAPAISGMPNALLNQVPSVQRLGDATYQGADALTPVALSWTPGLAPVVSGTTEDPFSDATILFSRDPTTITGIGVSLQSQPVTGFIECGTGPCCIPTAISYNRVTWPLPVNSSYARDDFTRSVDPGWGSPTVGPPYTLIGTANAFRADGEQGFVEPATPGFDYIATLAVGPDVDVTVKVVIPQLPTGVSSSIGIQARFVDGNNNYLAHISIDDALGLTTIHIDKVVATISSTIATSDDTTAIVVSTGSVIMMRFLCHGITLKFKLWNANEAEPDDWTLEVTDTDLSIGIAGLFIDDTAATISVAFDDLLITPARHWFGDYEIQRADSVTDWQTIALITSPAVTGFNDFEARVGVPSFYRIREHNTRGFAGLWSPTVTGTIASPGVTMPSCGTSKRGTLIFTSNEVQDGARNLAYAMVFDDSPNEEFTFIEAGSVEISSQLDRDYQIAFHGTERGGETFTRSLLLANAAVALPRLGNVQSLRDLAWDDLPYVCVRDDIGDRWFAAIIVPEGNVRRNRRLYNAEIVVVEVTDTPSPTDVQPP